VRGVINLRGDIVSVVDLRTYLGMEGSAPEESWRILVARSLLGEITSCLIVDRVEGIVRLPDASIQPPRLAPDERIAPYVRGFCEEASRILVVLDLDKLLLSEDFRRFE
jgi:chemotaxis signal transduction protein